MRRLVLGALLLLPVVNIGCSSIERPSWIPDPSFLTDSGKEFLDGNKIYDPK